MAVALPVVHDPVDRTREDPRPGDGGRGPGLPIDGGRGDGGGGGDDANERWSPGIYHVGMWATVTAVSTVFLTMAVVYIVRSQNPKFWKPLQLPGILWASTVILVASSATCEAYRRAVRRGSFTAHRIWLAATLSLGCVFLSTQLRAWAELNAEGVFVAANPHSFFLYFFTAVHAIHLVLGLMLLWYAFMRSVLPFWRDSNAVRRRELADAGTLYWHFLDGIWIGLFTLLLVRP